MTRWLRPLIRGLIQVYRFGISPWLRPSCRYYPSCSTYALEAFGHHSLGVAVRLVLMRLLRCHPWGGSGYDPVPPVFVRYQGNRSLVYRDLYRSDTTVHKTTGF